jgi:hypothetical protein
MPSWQLASFLSNKAASNSRSWAKLASWPAFIILEARARSHQDIELDVLISHQ